MKRIVNTYLIIICTATTLFAQGDIDYSGYHIAFRDDFRYPDPNGTYPSTAFQSDSVFNSKWQMAWHYPCSGWGHERYEKSQVTMLKNGIVRLTVDKNYDTVCNIKGYRNVGKMPVNHISGMLASKQQVNLGIIEARIKLPKGNGDTAAWPAFWMPWTDEGTNYTEIDVIDNSASNDSDIVSNIFFILSRNKKQVRYTGRTTKPTQGLLSSEFHTYSCVWEPSLLIFYVDGKYLHHMHYSEGQTYPNLHTILITLQTFEHTRAGITMDIDWVKYWEKDYSDNLSILQATTLPASLHKYQHIQLATKKKRKRIIIENESATILEAISTTISKNFVADESVPVSKKVVLTDHTTVTAPSNGYLIIRSPQSKSGK
jgi:beta-glucanase (GH16 family)